LAGLGDARAGLRELQQIPYGHPGLSVAIISRLEKTKQKFINIREKFDKKIFGEKN
jgi:hypothetical protein